jgi:hypothetical protein
MTLLEDTGLVHFNATPVETAVTGDAGAAGADLEPVAGPATFTAPIEPTPAPATSTTQGASIPVVSAPGPTAGTASTPAWWSSSESPRSA